jgi:phospholipid transport system substrate-binding protein
VTRTQPNPRIFRLWPALLLGLALCSGPVAGAAQDPEALVRQTTQSILDEVADRRQALEQNRAKLYALVDEKVLPHFDFEGMARIVLGHHWRDASPAQRERFVAEFRDLLVRTYAVALLEYDGQSIRYRPMRGNPKKGRVVVRTEVANPGAPPVPIDYRLSNRNGAWQVYDVVVDAVSLVTNYRSSYSQRIGRDGLDALIDAIAEKNKGALE